MAQLSSVVLHPGDIIFRRGNSAVSHVVLTTEVSGEFSHVGIVVVHGGAIFVVHSVPAETAQDRSGVRIEPLAVFVQPSRASSVAVYRLDATRVAGADARAQRAADAAEDMARRHVPFDFSFRLSTPDSVYCTELVLRAYARAGVNLEVKPAAQLPLMKEPIVFPTNLLQSPMLKRITH